jgi:hypothetical protein
MQHSNLPQKFTKKQKLVPESFLWPLLYTAQGNIIGSEHMLMSTNN